MHDFYQQKLKEWQNQARDYPTKALLVVTEQLYQQQTERLTQLQAQLDGTMWSPKEWRH